MDRKKVAKELVGIAKSLIGSFRSDVSPKVKGILRKFGLSNKFSVKFSRSPFSGGHDVVTIEIKDWEAAPIEDELAGRRQPKDIRPDLVDQIKKECQPLVGDDVRVSVGFDGAGVVYDSRRGY